MSELTARTNDDGWDKVFAEWLKVSQLRADDAVFVFSVGSTPVTAGGKPFHLSAPVVRAYHHTYIPLSFFGTGAVRTKVKISPDGRTGDIVLPPGEM